MSSERVASIRPIPPNSPTDLRVTEASRWSPSTRPPPAIACRPSQYDAACYKLLIAACRWIIMTSVQAFPVQTLGYRTCSLCSPMYRERLVHRSPAPRDGGRARPRRSHAPGGCVTCQSHRTTSRARNTRMPSPSASTTCLPAHPTKVSWERVAAPDGPGRHPGDPASGPGGAARGDLGGWRPGGFGRPGHGAYARLADVLRRDRISSCGCVTVIPTSCPNVCWISWLGSPIDVLPRAARGPRRALVWRRRGHYRGRIA